MEEYRFLKRTCPSCGTNLNAHRSIVANYSGKRPMGPCPTCGKALPLNAPEKQKEAVAKVTKDIIKGENEA